MKKLIIAAFLLPTLAYSFDTSVKGFIALNAFDYQKIQDKKGAGVIGIGVLDLKIFAEQDNMTAAMKLDLDGKLSEDYNIFEEAYASYRGIRDFRFTVGKGVVKFQNLHWGSVANTYLDGGSILGTENSWRKLSKKAFASVSYGHRSRGFLDTVWVWGDSSEIGFDEKGFPKFSGTTNVKSYFTNSVKAFNTDLQLGFANKIEIYKIDNFTFTNGLVVYKKKLQTNASYAMDLGLIYESADLEIWVDILAGHTQKPKFDSYTTYSNDELFIQSGFEKSLNEFWSWATNAEATYTRNQSWVYENSFVQDGKTYTVDTSLTEKSGQIVKTLNYKLETSAKYKLSKTAFTTIGVLYENKISEKNDVKDLSYIAGVYNANKSAYQLIGSISFWF